MIPSAPVPVFVDIMMVPTEGGLCTATAHFLSVT